MITLQFVLGKGLSSRAIAWFSAGHFSHVDAVMPDGSLFGARSDWIRGIQPGCRVRPANYESWLSVVRMSMDASSSKERLFYSFLKAQEGKPYDSTAIIAFMVGRDWRDTSSWFCSELQSAALEKCGVFSGLYLAANKITPVALALTASAAGFTVQK